MNTFAVTLKGTVMKTKNDKDKLIHKKRYGQYFSGKKVADLLVSLLPQDSSIKNAIDPMVGVGDMLVALKEKNLGTERLVGIEIDNTIIDLCCQKNPYADIIQGDVFSASIPKAPTGWDLVITNPPYIRYQLLIESNNVDELPSADEVRKNLVSTINKNRSLNKRDKKLFLNIAQSYSGLSDMAVPAWILCASMVKQNGILAMVVPDTWLSREYAIPIQYLLLRCFDIMSIVSDAGAAWFENAQVKTCLVVAKRKPTVDFNDALTAQTYCLKLGKSLIGEDSLVDNLQYKGASGLAAFSQIIQERPNLAEADCRASEERTYTLFPQLFADNKWFIKTTAVDNYDLLPVEIKEAIPASNSVSFETLSDSGWGIGQGLRTGANDFFYGELVSESLATSVIKTNWYKSDVSVEHQNLLHALQNRSEISGLYVSASQLSKRLIYITRQVRKADVSILSPVVSNYFSIMNENTAKYITAGETYTSIAGKSVKPFPERSAVKTNERKDTTGYRRFWYMLPETAPRHLPCLCMPRVCGKSIECLFVEQNRITPIAVDANFVTLWHDDDNARKFAFALLNSTWFKCYMECISTVMGGGALKVEASHVRKVFFPQYSAEQVQVLAKCGEKLQKLRVLNPQLQDEIDNLVLAPFGKYRMTILQKLRATLNRLLSERGATM